MIITVFIASPGDLAVERRAFKDTLDSLNDGFGIGADVEFVPLGWEDALYDYGRRPQSVINEDVDACDVFFLVMWRRWGQKSSDAKDASSYTEEEFNRAVERFEQTGAPKIYVLFKHVDQGQMADPGPQLKKVLAFRKRLHTSKRILPRTFADEKAFIIEVRNHLIDTAKRGPGLEADVAEPSGQNPTDLDLLKRELKTALEEIEKLKATAYANEKKAVRAHETAKSAKERTKAAEQAAEAEVAVNSLELAENAANAALDGRIEEARQDFAQALDGTTNLRILYLGYEFFARIGELDEAERLLQRWLAISGRDKQTAETADALGNLGLIVQTRGDLNGAVKLLHESLEINRKLGRLEGQASDLGKLGINYRTRGFFDSAEKLLRESLEINRKLDQLGGQASNIGSLGLVAQTRGDLDGAEKLLSESLEINRKLGRLEGQASDLGSLGMIAHTRSDHDGAEKLLRESLEINRKLGRPEGQASDLGCLGLIARSRGDLDGAEKFLRLSLEANRKIGRLEGQASDLGSLGRRGKALSRCAGN
jgi:tetratricopeptide (TPR) repeat protein